MWKRLMLSVLVAVSAASLMIDTAEARRVGGGRSMGMQRTAPTPQRDMTPPSTAPRQAAPGPAATQPAAQSGWRRFAAPLAGIAAGIGLASLLSHLGIGGEFAGIVLLVLAALVVFALLRRLRGGSAQPAYAGSGGNTGSFDRSQHDASPARFETPQAQTGVASQNAYVPAGFDVEAFARQAKVNFIRLQAANDNCNLEDIREFTSPEMFAEIKLDIDERGGARQKTDVVVLNAEVVQVAEENHRYVASVRYHGMVREEAARAAEAFDEVWHLSKPVDGSSGWVLSGIQQTA